MRMLLAVLVVLGFAGCTLDDGLVDGGSIDAGVVGDGGPGTATLTGQNAFGDAGAFESHLLDQSSGVTLGYEADITNNGLACSALESLNGARAPGSYAYVIIRVVGENVAAGPNPGTYSVVDTTPTDGSYGAGVGWGFAYSDGGGSGTFVATDGSVTVTQSSDTEFAGTFTATVPDANGQYTELSGTFDAPFCP